MNDSEPTSESMIENCNYFVSVAGLQSGSIITPTGDNPPQLELSHAMVNRKPTIGLVKLPKEKSDCSKQEYFRNLLKMRLGEKIFTFQSVEDIKGIVDLLLINGFDKYSEILKPNKVFISHSSKE